MRWRSVLGVCMGLSGCTGGGGPVGTDTSGGADSGVGDSGGSDTGVSDSGGTMDLGTGGCGVGNPPIHATAQVDVHAEKGGVATGYLHHVDGALGPGGDFCFEATCDGLMLESMAFE